MNRQHFTRRIVFGAVVVGLAILATVGGGDSALAAPVGEGSKKTFKEGCGQMGGVFVDSPKDNLTACFYDDGSKHVCDTNGSQCTYYPSPPKKLIDSGVDVADAPLIADDPQTVAPADAPLEAIAETEVAAPVDSQTAAAAESGTLAAPVEAPVTLTEEPMTAEASAEQP